MTRWIKILLTVVLTTSIPLEGLASVIMPMCNMSSASMNSTMAKNADATMSVSQPCDEICQGCCVPQNGKQSKETSSQNCFVCHISMTQMPVVLTLTLSPDMPTKFLPLINKHYQTFPPGLYHPPKLLSA